ncbi:MAG: hypothetical protein EBX39_12915 [Actinobacteria bacterium]|nr:hypothetical protein [Actinomycetota bacterium]
MRTAPVMIEEVIVCVAVERLLIGPRRAKLPPEMLNAPAPDWKTIEAACRLLALLVDVSRVVPCMT